MKYLMMLSAFVSMCCPSHAADEVPRSAPRAIVLTAGEGPFVFGGGIFLTVSYRNGGPDSWVIPTPTESTSVRVRYRPSGTDQHPQGYRLGRIRTTTAKPLSGQGTTAQVAPVAKTVTVAPGQSYDFKIALEREWTGDLEPGTWTAWIEDDALGLTSNRVEIPLRLTADSVTTLLEVARDPTQNVFKRKEHARWLQELVPGVALDWWSDDTPPQEKARREANVQQRLDAFQEFSKTESGVQATETAIARINQAAGVEK